jgi:thymidylate synthase ThyX
MPPHWTPFGHTAITVYVKAPIFVARQLGKHQVGFVWNEVSRRYVDSPPEFYVPDVWRKRAENKKQGSSKETTTLNGTQKCQYCLGEMSFLRPEDEKMKRFCSSTCQGNYYRKHTDAGWAKVKVSRIKTSAKKRNLEFNLTPEYLLSLGLPKYCKYLEVELDYSAESLQPNSVSLNRIDSSKGYIEGNVELISNKANIMLSNATPEELKLFLKNVSFENYGVFFNSAKSVGGFYEETKSLYKKLIEGGLAPEQARMFMPQSQFVEWYWTGNLYAFAKMFVARTDSHTQLETQEVAKMIGNVIQPLFPISWKALTT